MPGVESVHISPDTEAVTAIRMLKNVCFLKQLLTLSNCFLLKDCMLHFGFDNQNLKQFTFHKFIWTIR